MHIIYVLLNTLIQLVGTALLMACILAVTDKKNSKPVGGMEPFIVGLILFGIGIAYGYNCGFAVNPARDLAPRLFTYIAQYGSEVWTYVYLYIIMLFDC